MSGNDGPMHRPSVPEADRMIGVRRPVLSHGFVALVDYMGNDAAIVQAARVSYGQGTKSVRDDRGLIRYLMRHHHTTPFEMVEFKFLVRLPIYVARQWIRHRTACLAEGTRVDVIPPGSDAGTKSDRVSTPIEELWRQFEAPTPTPGSPLRREPPRGRGEAGLQVWHLDEVARRFRATRLVAVTRSGVKPVYRVRLEDGKAIDCTANHRFLFADGWGTLAERMGLREEYGAAVWDHRQHELWVNGIEVIAGPGASTATELTAEPRRPSVVPQLARILGVEFLGPRPTYDLAVEGPYHNFVANGIVTHNSVNEHSARYSIVPDEYELPPAEEVRRQSARNRQGRGEPLPPEVVDRFRTDLERLSSEAYGAYTRALEAGVARETARMVLPVSYYTQWYWKSNLHNLFHFLSLRLDAHAQEEIRRYSAEVANIARIVCPIAFEAFEEFSLEGIRLGRRERIAVNALLEGKTPEAACEAAGLALRREDGQPVTTGEGPEFLEKLERIRRVD